jgi:eukaryotic-like serine/threonine-protein kinase
MIGKTISHYQIVEKLGEGGMGIVYKAEDTKLKRFVALKFLPPELLKDEDAKERFILEARAASALDHPNIITIYSINETAENQVFIAMAYNEGEALNSIIKKGPLKISQALEIAIQVAQGLEKAHKNSIVHRDIKPGNIMVSGECDVKILDFGLAKLTGKTQLTKQGSTLGTISYMSPEQGRGEKVDHRTDIWSLGVVLYEMLTGQLPFKGEYEQAVTYSIQSENPEPLTALRTGVPMELERIVNKLLAKDPKNRYQNIIELPVDLKNIDLKTSSNSKISTTVISRNTNRSKLNIRNLALVFISLFIGAFTIWHLKPTALPRKQSITRFSIQTPKDTELSTHYGSVSISPDGKQIVFVALKGTIWMLYRRSLDQLGSVPIPGKERAEGPFFSPNSQHIGFFSDGKINRIPLEGGKPITVCDAPGVYFGATWTNDNTIIFNSSRNILMTVSASGGTPELLTKPDTLRGSVPRMLPDGEHVLFKNRDNIAIINLKTRKWKNLYNFSGLPFYYSLLYYIPGYIVYQRSEIMMTVPFNLQQLKVTGLPVQLDYDIKFCNYSSSNTGTLIYIPDEVDAKNKRLAWIDRKGILQLFTNQQDNFRGIDISPDGRQVAVTIEYEQKRRNIWLYNVDDVSRPIQKTFEGTNYAPAWSPDGQWLAFNSFGTGSRGIYLLGIDKNKGEFLNETNKSYYSPSWSADGKYLAFFERNPDTNTDIMITPVNNDSPERFVATSFEEHSPAFSPTGNWLAYNSSESGQDEIYVRTVPDTSGKYLISVNGGLWPQWGADEHELFYFKGDTLISVQIETTPAFKVVKTEQLFTGKFANSYDYDPNSDRFLLIKTKEVNQIHVVMNLDEELKDKFDTEK